MIEALLNISAAFGLSTSAGLNAYIPLLMVAVVGRFTNWITLKAPYDVITNEWVIVALAVLLVIELLADKVPVVDSVNDALQTFVRPAAGALLFAASTNVISDISPVLAVIAGLLLAGGVHAVKGTVRPVVTASTAGTGNWLVSLLEDIIAFFVSLFSLIFPVLALIFMLLVGWWAIRLVRRRRRKKLSFN